MAARAVSLALLAALARTAAAKGEAVQSEPVLVAGATGRTGALVYAQLKSKGIEVRAFVRNATKAREVLGCTKCDESEGIFVGDLTDPATMLAPIRGAKSLVIASSASPVCNPFPKCTFPKGAFPIDVDWVGAKALLAAFAGSAGNKAPVVLVSTMGTTEPEEANDDVFQHISFYKLNFEAELMSSGLPFTIIKPCGLLNTPPTSNVLVVGHDDDLKVSPPVISRADVARVVVASLERQDLSAGLRFDLCSQKGQPTADAALPALLHSAKPYLENEAAPLVV